MARHRPPRLVTASPSSLCVKAWVRRHVRMRTPTTNAFFAMAVMDWTTRTHPTHTGMGRLVAEATSAHTARRRPYACASDLNMYSGGRSTVAERRSEVGRLLLAAKIALIKYPEGPDRHAEARTQNLIVELVLLAVCVPLRAQSAASPCVGGALCGCHFDAQRCIIRSHLQRSPLADRLSCFSRVASMTAA